MSWVKWTLTILGLGLLVNSLTQPAPPSRRSGKHQPKQVTPPKQKVEAALASGDLDGMISAADEPAIAPLDRHLLLQAIVDKTYPRRQDPAMKVHFMVHARRYVEEFSRFQPVLGSQGPESAASTPVFKRLAMVLTQDGLYDEAVEVCRQALHFGVEDGTKTGFEGRILRIQKQQGG